MLTRNRRGSPPASLIWLHQLPPPGSTIQTPGSPPQCRSPPSSTLLALLSLHVSVSEKNSSPRGSGHTCHEGRRLLPEVIFGEEGGAPPGSQLDAVNQWDFLLRVTTTDTTDSFQEPVDALQSDQPLPSPDHHRHHHSHLPPPSYYSTHQPSTQSVTSCATGRQQQQQQQQPLHKQERGPQRHRDPSLPGVCRLDLGKEKRGGPGGGEWDSGAWSPLGAFESSSDPFPGSLSPGSESRFPR
ncbi:unnamed protein product [Pleuronectes platessa]|uniref:Uncharacterized protein n=1 Tax=Pleuronectes platessa TaxID=8262 RepID=A0A9N7Z6H0_PLEPL|nr:unnamed protein product [Pleuronectes platessa]